MSKIHEAKIDNLSLDGRGVARIQGKTTFIAGALPGERVTCQLTHQHRHHDEGGVETILSSSESRVSPRCPHYETCGGCVLQHLDPTAQLQFKEASFWETLKKIGRVEPEIKLPAIESQSWHYRHRAKLHVQVKNKAVSVGFKSKTDPNVVVSIHTCPILMRSLSILLLDLHRLLQQFVMPKSVKHILMAEGNEGVGLLFCARGLLHTDDVGRLQQFASQHQCAVFIQTDLSQQPNAIFPESSTALFTYPFHHETHRLQFSLTDFTQVNVQVNESMLDAAKTMMKLGAEDMLGDLYCGLGNFSLSMAPHVRQVIGAEYEAAMVREARQNAALNQLDNIHYETLDLENPMEINRFLKRHEFNKLLLDPPRSGARQVVEALAGKKIKGLLYVSCHPGTLARDAHILVHEKKYKLKSARVLDMFPHTGHIEAMAWFEI